jgi:hypothetical protein
LEREQFSWAYSLTEALYVSPAIALISLRTWLGMKNFHLRWVPHQFADNLRQVRVAKCREFLCALEAIQQTHFHHIITGDESWFDREYQHASQWLVSRGEMP